MRNIFLLALSLLATSAIFSQNTISLKGKIIDKNSTLPLESATIYLKTVKDSTVVDYTISDKNGNFEIKTKKNESPIYFKVSYIGYTDYTEKLDNLSKDKDFGFIKLKLNIKLKILLNLQEVFKDGVIQE